MMLFEHNSLNIHKNLSQSYIRSIHEIILNEMILNFNFIYFKFDITYSNYTVTADITFIFIYKYDCIRKKNVPIQYILINHHLFYDILI